MAEQTNDKHTKYILVTGANKGVGRATVAAILDQDDDTHVFLGSRSVERGQDARSVLLSDRAGDDDRVEVVQIDVSDDASVNGAAEAIRSKIRDQPMHGVVNNAGIGDREHSMREVLDVNVRGPKRVCEAFLPLLGHPEARIVNVASASGPNFVAQCSPERQRQLTDPEVTWEQIEALMEEAVAIDESDGDFASAGFGSGSAYGLSKACLNAYTVALARENPELTVNACTPGFIETDMTRPMAERQGADPEELGMKPPEQGTRAQIFLLFGHPEGSGWYFGSDAKRSPLDEYRSPGNPPYTGD